MGKNKTEQKVYFVNKGHWPKIHSIYNNIYKVITCVFYICVIIIIIIIIIKIIIIIIIIIWFQ